MRKSWIAVSAIAVAVVGQNFDHVTDAFLDHRTNIDQNIRVSHAKELLGKYYFGSEVEYAELKEDLPKSILTEIKSRLPEKFKSHASSLSRMILKEAQGHDLDPVFVMAVIQTESRFQPLARGTHGEIGLMQLKPSTAEWIAKKNSIPWHGPHTLENPAQNVRIGIAYMAHLRDQMDHSANKYLSAYNIGARKVMELYAHDIKPKEYTIPIFIKR